MYDIILDILLLNIDINSFIKYDLIRHHICQFNLFHVFQSLDILKIKKTIDIFLV